MTLRPNLLKTTTFRLTLIYMIIFGGFVTLVVVSFYYSTVRFMESQTDQTIDAEVLGLAEAHRTLGAEGLKALVERRSLEQSDSLYLLIDEEEAKLAGNLPLWPSAPIKKGGWINFAYDRDMRDTTVQHDARARIFQLAGGGVLLVGRDIEQRLAVENTLTNALFTAIAFIVLVGSIGGLVLSASMLRRIDSITSTSREIMAGDLSRRVPMAGKGDELDDLAGNLNDMLAQIERLMTGMREVTDNVAHDLRSPLTRLRNRLEVTLMAPASSDEYREALVKTIKDADHLLTTFNALLSIAQVEAGSTRDEVTDVKMGDVVRDIAELYEPVAEEKNVSFSLEVEGEAMVRGNRGLLSQALANLTDNAIKYTPEGGAVHVAFRAPKLTGLPLEIAVSDNGPGIPPQDRDRVVKRFVRLDASRNTQGTGLGLSLVAAVAKMHEGQLILGSSQIDQDEDTPPGLKAMLRLPTIIDVKKVQKNAQKAAKAA